MAVSAAARCMVRTVMVVAARGLAAMVVVTHVVRPMVVAFARGRRHAMTMMMRAYGKICSGMPEGQIERYAGLSLAAAQHH